MNDDPNYPYDKSKVTLPKGYPEDNFGISGTLNRHEGYSFSAKVFDEGSRFGIHDGRISKLSVSYKHEEVISFQRVWAVGEPNLTDEQALVLNDIVSAFPEPREREMPAPKESEFPKPPYSPGNPMDFFINQTGRKR